MDKETDMIVDKIEKLFDQLQCKGYSMPAILIFFEPQQKLSPILVTKDYRIILTDYDNMEILFPPVLKAMFIILCVLFLLPNLLISVAISGLSDILLLSPGRTPPCP